VSEGTPANVRGLAQRNPNLPQSPPPLSLSLSPFFLVRLRNPLASELEVGDGFLAKLGLSRADAQRLSHALDPLEHDQHFQHYVKLSVVSLREVCVCWGGVKRSV
jgi:hypothetical protein